MNGNPLPIYLAVCEDLQVFPQAIRPRTHQRFMRDAHQDEWLQRAQSRAFDFPEPLHEPSKPRARKRTRTRKR